MPFLFTDYIKLLGMFNVLIGLTDAAMEGTWVWTDGGIHPYTHWYQNQPNGGNVDNCVSLLHSVDTLWWFDGSCNTPRPYVCQRGMFE